MSCAWTTAIATTRRSWLTRWCGCTTNGTRWRSRQVPRSWIWSPSARRRESAEAARSACQPVSLLVLTRSYGRPPKGGRLMMFVGSAHGLPGGRGASPRGVEAAAVAADEGIEAGDGDIDELVGQLPLAGGPTREGTHGLQVDRVAVPAALALADDDALRFELVQDGDDGALGHAHAHGHLPDGG